MTENLFDLTGKVSLVTGGNSGLGLASPVVRPVQAVTSSSGVAARKKMKCRRSCHFYKNKRSSATSGLNRRRMR